MKKLLILLELMLLIIAACTPTPPPGAECSKDSDCGLVTTTCCPCSMGGTQLCAPKSMAAELAPKDCSEDLYCTAVYNCNIASCVCRNNKCQAS